MSKKIIAALFFALLLAGPALAGDLGAISASYEPAPAAPSSLITVWVTIKNDSTYKAENSIVQIETEFPFSLLPGELAEKQLGSINPFETRLVEYKLLVDARALSGDHQIKVLVGEGFVSKETNFTISVLTRTPKLEIVGSSVNELKPGAVQPVVLTIKNVGGSIAKDIVLKVNPDRTVTSTGTVVEREIVSLGAASNYIDHLNQGAEADVEMTLAVNQGASLKNYSIPITMEYFDQNGTAKTGTAYLGIKVDADADVDAVLNSVTPSAFPGGTSEVVVDLFNVGLADARYVVVELSGNNVKVEEPRQFIGTLEADDFDSFKTKMTFDPMMPLGEQPLSLKVIYKDEELNEQVITKTLSINVVSAAEAQGGSGNAFLGLFGLITLVLQLIGLYVVAKWAWPRAGPTVNKIMKKFKKK